ncbi:hypothetical protein L3X38_025581 [Prunus dulcis]|uniref:Uncharacterized protein n=1 Tax=Prunus dulcis TaxID=3755 RepID=A0AAD4W244_PRUDU|nr:hypothetical protein L3X38_025581 [Prunus dulcis]
MDDFNGEKVEEMVVIVKEWMAGMAAGMVAAAKGRKEGGLMVAGVLEQPRDVGRWLLGYLQQPKDRATKRDSFCLGNASQFIEGEGSLWFPISKRKCWS